jgi:ABC-type nitrate/sulfonate/bicarbonate transport system substrate-binding protein
LYPDVRNGVTLNSWQDLKGKKVAVGVGGAVWTTFVSKLREAGVDYNDLKAVGIQGSGRNFILALQRGDVDVSISWSPFTEASAVEKAGSIAENLEFGSTQELGSDQGMWTTTRSELASHRDVIERFLWAYAKAEEITNLDGATKLKTIEEFSGQSPEVAALTAKWTRFGSATSLEQMQKMSKLLFELGLIPSDVTDKIKGHYDTSIADGIQSSGALPVGR